MRNPGTLFAFMFFFLLSGFFTPLYPSDNAPDVPQEEYLIMNGKVWRNLYTGVKGNAYFLTNEYLTGDITFNGRLFRERTLRYDLYNDEIILWINSSNVIILNKEMVGEFTVNYMDKRYRVVNMGTDTAGILSGYVNVYYEGPTALYVKYRKQIEMLAVDNKYDLFVQSHRIYVKKNGDIVQVSGRKALLKLLSDRKTELKNYIKQNKLLIVKSEPQTFIPLLQYYDSLDR